MNAYPYRIMEPANKICFEVENTLGKLAKWLRILGFDTVYLPGPQPGGFRCNCGRNRLLLTRTRRVAARLHKRRVMLIESDDPRQQVRQVIRELAIGRGEVRLFSRCVRCNAVVEPIEKKEVSGRVPDYVWETHRSFSICPDCRRVYWAGSHFRHSLKMVESIYGS